MKHPRVAMVGSVSGFARCDQSILASLGAEVRQVGTSPAEILRAVRWSSHVVCWFAGEHAFYARLFSGRKPMLLILGGVEAVGEPQYGLWGRRWDIRRRARWAIEKADELWAVAPHVAFDALSYTGPSRCHLPQIVHTVFDPARFVPLDKNGTVAFACPSEDRRYRWRKGVATVVAANLDGIIHLGTASETEYPSVLGRARVILNASRYEGLNNTLCEGMLAGAVPVVSDIDGNRYAVDGLREARVFPANDPAALRGAVLDALAGSVDPLKVREYVLRRFPVDARRRRFRDFMEAA